MTVIDSEGAAIPQIARDRWDRPMVTPPQGGPPVAYTRCTTFVGAADDPFNLNRWRQRMVAKGLAARPDLLLSVAAHREDDQRLNVLCADALEAGGGLSAAVTGTALHSLTETMDRGLDVGPVPEAYVADLAAYAKATEDLSAVHIEPFSVYDPFRIGGTPDRVVTYQGERYIADLKTGSIKWGYVKIAAQLAVYARSVLYDVVTGERTPHGADLERGIVIHLPAGTGTCRLYWIDLKIGWKAVQVCREVRVIQQTKLSATLTPIEDPVTVEASSEQAVLPGLDRQPPTIEDLIRDATSKEQVIALWSEHQTTWSDDLTTLAKERVAAFDAA